MISQYYRSNRTLGVLPNIQLLIICVVLLCVLFLNIENAQGAGIDVQQSSRKIYSENVIENTTASNTTAGQHQINDIIVIVIIITVLLILLVLFRIFDINHHDSEKARLRNAGLALGQDNLKLDENVFFATNFIAPYGANMDNTRTYTLTRDFKQFRCWRCNVPIESKDFCPHCGWMGETKRVVGYWGLFK